MRGSRPACAGSCVRGRRSLAHDALGADGDLAQAEAQMEVDLSRRYDKEKRSHERSLRHLSRPSFLVPARGKTLARHQLSAADI